MCGSTLIAELKVVVGIGKVDVFRMAKIELASSADEVLALCESRGLILLQDVKVLYEAEGHKIYHVEPSLPGCLHCNRVVIEVVT